MSLRDQFRSAWKSKFPSDQPPELECFRTLETASVNTSYRTFPGGKEAELDKEAVERSLGKCNENIVKYELLLQKEKFITSFLWEALHNANHIKESSRSGVSRSGTPGSKTLPGGGGGGMNPGFVRSNTSDCVMRDDALDSVIPAMESPTSLGETYCNISELGGTESGRGYFRSSDLTPSTSSPYSKVPSQDLDSPVDSVYSSSVTLSGESTNHTDSKSSSNVKPSTSVTKGFRPTPAPRATKLKAAGEESSPGSLWGRSKSSENLCESPDLGPRFSSARSRPQPKLPAEVNLIVSLKDNKVTSRNSQVTVHDREVGGQVGVVGQGVQETCIDDVVNNDQDIYSSTNELYEQAAPVHREFIEEEEPCSSESDEEPLYFNLQKLKEQTMARAKTWYASRDELKAVLTPDTVEPLTPTSPSPSNYSKLSTNDSVRSTGSDSMVDSDIPFGWKRRSLFKALNSVDSSSELDELNINRSELLDEDKLKMRLFVVKSVLDSEKTYLSILDILMQYMTTFRNCLGTPQAVISGADIDVIFNKIPDLHKAHKLFMRDLQQKFEDRNITQQISDPFRVLATEEYLVASDYLKNYQKAVDTIHRCRTESEKFAQFSVQMKVPHMVEKPNLEELLHKPVVRFQRNTLLLHDLIEFTPASHADFDPLNKVQKLAQDFLINFESSSGKESAESLRYLAKQGLIVEKVGNSRKLRHIFLFNDVIVCAKPKFAVKQRPGFEPKWYIPLKDLSLDDKACVEEEKQLADSQQQEIQDLQKKVAVLQKELKSELRQVKGGSGEAQRQWSFHNRSRNIDKIKKKLIEEQAAMIKASPRLLFRVHNRKHSRQYTLLMASDYERSNWRFTIAGLLSRVHTSLNLSSTDLQNMLNSQKLPKVSTLESLIDIQDIALEEEHLFGCLNITIYRLQGLKTASEAYCTVEVDSFGHFFTKAKTKTSNCSTEPVWNQDFEVDLEGAQTVRILCYTINGGVSTLKGTCALELSRAWLRGDFTEKSVFIKDEISVVISLGYVSRQQTLKRTLTNIKGGLFGAKIKTVTKRESSTIPLIVTGCVQEVENRGLEEVGVYRISGASGEIQKLKQTCEKNINAGCQLLKESDINVVTGLLKLYFRELPEALFTDKLYTNLVTGMGLKDPDAKETYILSVLQTLPEPNKATIIYILDHLIRVAAPTNGNKMSLQNLATVFGPTLLRPAVSLTQSQSMEELFCVGTREALTQTTMLLYILTIRNKGATF